MRIWQPFLHVINTLATAYQVSAFVPIDKPIAPMPIPPPVPAPDQDRGYTISCLQRRPLESRHVHAFHCWPRDGNVVYKLMGKHKLRRSNPTSLTVSLRPPGYQRSIDPPIYRVHGKLRYLANLYRPSEAQLHMVHCWYGIYVGPSSGTLNM